MEHLDERLERIETKLDAVLHTHSNRLTAIETEQGFFKIALTALFTAAGWVMNKLYG